MLQVFSHKLFKNVNLEHIQKIYLNSKTVLKLKYNYDINKIHKLYN
jgi:hypothetical protein